MGIAALSGQAAGVRGVLVFGVSAIIFFLLNAIGNPIDMLMADNPGVTDEALAAVKAYYHLDAGVGHRYMIWLGNVARGWISAPPSP